MGYAEIPSTLIRKTGNWRFRPPYFVIFVWTEQWAEFTTERNGENYVDVYQ